MASNLTKDWIQYLKNNQIVAMQSDPKSGKLNYKRPVTTSDVVHFLQVKTDYDDSKINQAIETALGQQTDATDQQTASQSNNLPAVPSKQGGPVDVNTRGMTPGQQQPGLPGPGPTKPQPKPKKYDTSNATDVEPRYSNQTTPHGASVEDVINPETDNERPKDFVPVTLKRIGAKPRVRLIHKSAVPGWENSGWVAGGATPETNPEPEQEQPPEQPQQPEQEQSPEQPQARAQGGGRVKGQLSQTPGAIRKRQARANRKAALNEDFKDNPGEQLSEKQVEQIFRILSKKTDQTDQGTEKNTSVDPQQVRVEEVNKLKRFIRDTMTDQQRMSLWRALNEA